LTITTEPATDFWQRTHYGFQRDNGHALLRSVKEDFCFSARVRFRYAGQFDQCGLMVRIDGENWIKQSLEYEDASLGRLGSVVTNHGYSDWATTDTASDISALWYRVVRQRRDFFLYHSEDGQTYRQMRITHLPAADADVYVGVYACSPQTSSFRCHFDELALTRP